jgi:hypothetical protein
MKRKSLVLSGGSLVKWHSIVFALCMIAMWWSALSTFSYPGNDRLPFEMFRSFIIDRIWITILWGFVLMVHVGEHQIRTWTHAHNQQKHRNSIQVMQARYVPTNQLDVEASGDEMPIDYEHHARHSSSHSDKEAL